MEEHHLILDAPIFTTVMIVTFVARWAETKERQDVALRAAGLS